MYASKARRFEGSLNIHLEVDHVGDELRVGLRLVPAAHDAEGHASVALLGEGRNDGVQRALAAGEHVGESASSVNKAPRLWSAKPVPGATIPDPNSLKLLCIRETMFPSRSTMVRKVVSVPTRASALGLQLA